MGNSPWVIGWSMAEQDVTFGFGAGSSDDFVSVPPGHNNPHLSYIVLITNPNQTFNATWNVTYTDTTVYAKQALKDFLQNRYGTIGALNTAWNSSYTSFDSDGGWGAGSGLLDEDGRHAWVPHFDTLAGATPQMKQDLDDYLFLYAEKFFSLQSNALKSRFPNMMYWLSLTPVLGRSLDPWATSSGQHRPRKSSLITMWAKTTWVLHPTRIRWRKRLVAWSPNWLITWA